MAEGELGISFHREPLRFLERTFPAAGDTAWLPGRQLCVAAPEAALGMALAAVPLPLNFRGTISRRPGEARDAAERSSGGSAEKS